MSELETFAAASGHVVVERYIDEGWSGSLLNRPALDALRDAAERKSFDAVVINDVDRLSRDIANLAVVKRDLERKGVDVIFRKLPTDKGPLSDFMVNILGSFAEFERAMITDRTRRGRRFKVQEKKIIIGNKPPYGYTYVKKDRDRGIEGRYELRPEEARVVRMMFEWVAEEGLSDRAVARRLVGLGIRARCGRPWAWSSVHRILTNETYTGVTYFNKFETVDVRKVSTRKWIHRYKTTVCRYRPKSEWIPIPLPPELHIVDRALFDRAQMQRKRNQAFSPRNVKLFYLLRKVRKVCGRCGRAFCGATMHGLKYYRCSASCGQMVGKPRCRSRSLNAKTIEPLVWRAIEEAVQNPEVIAEQVVQQQERFVAQRAGSQAEVKKLDSNLAALDEEEDRVLAAYRTKVTSLAQFEKEIAKVNETRSALQLQLALAHGNAPKVVPQEQVARDVTQWTAAIRERLGNLTGEEQAETVGLLLDEIVFHDDHLVIRGLIPASAEQSSGCIAPTSSARRGRNATYAFEVGLQLAARSRGVTRRSSG